MINALITQREEISKYGTLFESLEKEYINYFESIGINLFPISNFSEHTVQTVKDYGWDLIILTGGGIIEQNAYNYVKKGWQQNERNELENKLLNLSENLNIPVVGICRGMHQINAFYGGKIDKNSGSREIGKNHTVVVKESNKELIVNHYHDDEIHETNLGNGLFCIAYDKENKTVEAFTDYKRILGIQWHPERMDDCIVKLWIKKLLKLDNKIIK